LALASCKNAAPQSCFGLQRGDRIELTVVEPYDSHSQFTFSPQYSSDCELGFDLANNQKLEATVVDLAANDNADCESAIASMGPVGDWTWQLQSNQGGPTDLFLAGRYTATRGQCTGTVGIRVNAGMTPFVPSVVGQPPHVLLERFFNGQATNPACPGDAGSIVGGTELTCNGTFVVNARKL
jgi:hypothetical protein